MPGDETGEEVPEKIRVTADTGINGVLEAHNLLVEKVLKVNKDLEDFKKSHADSTEEQKKELANRLEALEAGVDAKGKALKTVDEKLTALEKSSEAERKALRHSIDEISNHQAELKSRTLPDWEAGLRADINRLREDIIGIQGELKERLEKAEKAAEELQEMLNKDEGFKMAGVLQSQVNSLEAFVKKQDEILTAGYNSRLEQLETALRQSDYERLIFSERVGQDLQGMSQHLRGFASLLTDISQHLEQVDGQDGSGLRKVQVEVDSLKEVTSKLRKDFEARSEKTEASHAASMSSLGSRYSELEKAIRSEVERLSMSKSTKEVERIQRLEAEMKQEREERRSFITRFEKEERERVESWQKRSSEVHQVDMTLETSAVDSVRKELEELKLNFQSLLMAEDQRMMDAARLEALVRALEDRVWPWRRNSKDRSRSPTRSPSPGPGPPVTVEVDVSEPNWALKTIGNDLTGVRHKDQRRWVPGGIKTYHQPLVCRLLAPRVPCGGSEAAGSNSFSLHSPVRVCLHCTGCQRNSHELQGLQKLLQLITSQSDRLL
eukprot:s141_g21.t1